MGLRHYQGPGLLSNRVLIDGPGGVLKISKAGVNVLTAGQDGLLFSSDNRNLHPVLKGQALLSTIDIGSDTSGGVTNRLFRITHSNVGFIAFAQISLTSGGSMYRLMIRAQTATTITFGVGYAGSDAVLTAKTVYYVLTSMAL